MEAKTHIFPNPDLLVEALGTSFKEAEEEADSRGEPLHVAVPGGSTPKKFFQYLSGPFADSINWDRIHFYWGDERCVPPDHPESNFGMTKKALLDKIDIPIKNIHRIQGESDPESEILRYSHEIKTTVSTKDQSLPQFDWIILGLGADGHTASLFPKMISSLVDEQICTIATHPQSGQKRISLTLSILNNAKRVTFLVTGKSKTEVVTSILMNKSDNLRFPAALVSPHSGKLDWYLDQEAGRLL